MTTECPDCEQEYSQLGKHLTGQCSVSIDTELIDALLIGDGTLDNGGNTNYRLTVTTTEPEYAKHIEELLGWLHTSTRSTTYDDVRKEVYRVRTHCLSDITTEYKRWYPNGDKRIPDDFTITPFTLKHWYCADGHLKDNSSNPRFSIGCKFENDRRTFVEELFPFPATYVGYEICFKTADTEKIANYMGNPLPGFRYKWP
jgi:hypothetical protein